MAETTHYKYYKYSPQMTTALVRSGLSQRGADQLLTGQVITDPADRQIAAEVLWHLLGAPGADRTYKYQDPTYKYQDPTYKYQYKYQGEYNLKGEYNLRKP